MNKKKIMAMAITLTVFTTVAGTAFAASDDGRVRGSSDDGFRRIERRVSEIRGGATRFFSGFTDLGSVLRRSVNTDDNSGRQSGSRVDNSGPGSVNSSRINSSLVRGEDGRVFAVRNGVRTPVRTITELRNGFSGVTIQNINNIQLRSVPVVFEDNPSRAGDDNLPRHSGIDSAFRSSSDDNSVRHSGFDDSSTRSDDSRGRRGGEIGGGRSFDD